MGNNSSSQIDNNNIITYNTKLTFFQYINVIN